MNRDDFLRVISNAVCLECDVEQVSVDATFAASGIDSMGLMGLLINLDGLPVSVSLNDIIAHPTPRRLATALEIRHCGGLYAWLTACQNHDRIALDKYAELVIATPYNSARAFLEIYGGDALPSGKWGHNCIGLSQAAHAELIGSDRAVYLEWGRRRPVLLASSGEVYFADPYALHRECASVGKLLSGRQSAEVFPCFPAVGHTMELSVDADVRELVQTKRTPRGSMTCQYGTETVLAHVDPLDHGLLFDNEQDNLSIRVLSEDLTSTVHVVIPLEHLYRRRRGRAGVKPAYFAILHDELYDRGHPAFDTAIAILAARIGVNGSEVMDFLEAAFMTYMQHAPEGLTFQKSHANASNL